MTVKLTTSVLGLYLVSFLSGNALSLYFESPPDPENAALMARYIIHNSGWVSLATISTQEGTKGYPFVTLKSLSDGPENNATGVPYLYMTAMDVSGQDVQVDRRITILATLAEGDYCDTNEYDPQDPRCAKVIITGKYKKINESSAEYKFGQEALFAKHPAMKIWPAGHDFYVASMDLEQIDVLDYFGGIKKVTVEEYFNATLTKFINVSSFLRKISVIQINANNND